MIQNCYFLEAVSYTNVDKVRLEGRIVGSIAIKKTPVETDVQGKSVVFEADADRGLDIKRIVVAVVAEEIRGGSAGDNAAAFNLVLSRDSVGNGRAKVAINLAGTDLSAIIEEDGDCSVVVPVVVWLNPRAESVEELDPVRKE